MGYIGDTGELASTGRLNYLHYLSWVPKIRLCTYQRLFFLCVSSYRCCCSMCSHVKIIVSLFGLNASDDVPRAAETRALAMETVSENRDTFSRGQLATGLDCPGFTLLMREPAGLHLAQLCWNTRPSYLQLQ